MRHDRPAGTSLRNLRRHAGLTQLELAARAGVSVNTIRLVEGGAHLTDRTAAKLAAALHTDVARLMAPAHPVRTLLGRATTNAQPAAAA